MALGNLPAEEKARLIEAAREVAQNAYAPYSNWQIGAAVLTSQGNIVTGCNVENASFGLTICAERAAIFSAIAKEGRDFKLKALAVVNQTGGACPPCGACRQVIFEFGPEAIIIFQGKDGLTEMGCGELLPEGFRFI